MQSYCTERYSNIKGIISILVSASNNFALFLIYEVEYAIFKTLQFIVNDAILYYSLTLIRLYSVFIYLKW